MKEEEKDLHTSLLLPENGGISINSAVEHPITPRSQRLIFIDLFRGITIFFMVIVDNLGDEADAWHMLCHPTWNGFTVADVVFPSFLFIVGSSIHLAMKSKLLKCERGELSKRKLWTKIAVRTLLLLGIGILVSFTICVLRWEFDHLRLAGVLQRIAICYFIVSAMYITLPDWGQYIAVVCFASIYLGFMYGYDVPKCGRGVVTYECSAETVVDRTVLTDFLHTRTYSQYGWDPEGILSCCNAVVTTFFGLQFAKILSYTQGNKSRVFLWSVISIVLLILGTVLANWVPLNKKIWSPSYTLVAGGISGTLFIMCYVLLDAFPSRIWSIRAKYFCTPLIALGMNALAIFIGMLGLEILLMDAFHVTYQGESITPWTCIYLALFRSWIQPDWASFLVGMIHTAIWTCVAYGLYKKNIIFKI